MKFLTISCLVLILVTGSSRATPLGLLSNLVNTVSQITNTAVTAVDKILTDVVLNILSGNSYTLDVITLDQTSSGCAEIAKQSGVTLTPAQLNITTSAVIAFQLKVKVVANVDPLASDVVALNATAAQIIVKLKADLAAAGFTSTNAAKFYLGIQSFLLRSLGIFLTNLTQQFSIVTDLLSTTTVTNAVSVSTAVVTDVLSIVSGKYSTNLALKLNTFVANANIDIALNGDLSLKLTADQLASLNSSIQASIDNTATAVTGILFDTSKIPQDLLNRFIALYNSGINQLLRRTLCGALRIVRTLVTTLVSVVNSLLKTITTLLFGQVRDTINTMVNPLLANVTSILTVTLTNDAEILFAKVKAVVENVNDIDDFLSVFRSLWKSHCYRTRLSILKIVYDQVFNQVGFVRTQLLGLIAVDVVNTLDTTITAVGATVGSILDGSIAEVFTQITNELNVALDGVVSVDALTSVSTEVASQFTNLQSEIEVAVNSLDVPDALKQKLNVILKARLQVVQDTISNSQTPDKIVTASVILRTIFDGLVDSTNEISSDNVSIRIRYIGFTLRNILNRVIVALGNLTQQQISLLTTLVENIISKANIDAQAAISVSNVADGQIINDIVLQVITNAGVLINTGLTNIKATGLLTLTQQQIFSTISGQVLIAVKAELTVRPIISIVANLVNTVTNVVKTTLSGRPNIFSLDVLNLRQIVNAVREVVNAAGRVLTEIEARLIGRIVVNVQVAINTVVANGDVSGTVIVDLNTLVTKSKILIVQALQNVGYVLVDAQDVANSVTTYLQNLVNTVVNGIKLDQTKIISESDSDQIYETVNHIAQIALSIHVTLNDQHAKDINNTLSQAVTDIQADLNANVNLTAVTGAISAILVPITETVSRLVDSVTDTIITNNGAEDILNTVPLLYANAIADIVKNGISGHVKILRRLLVNILGQSNDGCSPDQFVKVRAIVDLAIANATVDVSATINDIIGEDATNFHIVYDAMVESAVNTNDLALKLQNLLSKAYYNLKRHVLNSCKQIIRSRVKIVRDLISAIIPNNVLINIDTVIDVTIGNYIAELNLKFVDVLLGDFTIILQKIQNLRANGNSDVSVGADITTSVSTALDSVLTAVKQVALIPVGAVNAVVDIINKRVKASANNLIYQVGTAGETPIKLALFVNKIDFDAQAEVQANDEIQYVQFILNELKPRVLRRLALTAAQQKALNILINTNINLANKNCAAALSNADLGAAANVNAIIYQQLEPVLIKLKADVKVNTAFSITVRGALNAVLDDLIQLSQFDLGRATVQINVNANAQVN